MAARGHPGPDVGHHHDRATGSARSRGRGWSPASASRRPAGSRRPIRRATSPPRRDSTWPASRPTSCGGYNAATRVLKFTPSTTESNNWVVDGTLSASGKPLLASDPHRPIALPSLRYLVHLNAPGWNVIGSGEPALPGVALGHNERIAWGFTIVGTDQADLFVEETNPADPRQYKVGDTLGADADRAGLR